MIAEDTFKIIKEICALIGDAGGDCSQWHIGVTANPNVGVRGASEEDSRWRICRQAPSAWEARHIVKGFWNIDCHQIQTTMDALEGDSVVYVVAYRNAIQRQPAISHELLIESRLDTIEQGQAECVC